MSSYSGRAAGAFGALGGVIEFVWVPSPEVVSQEIMRISGYLEDMVGPLRISKQLAREDVARRFRTQTDPEGNPWVEWSESYEPYALRTNLGRILEQSLSLKEAATLSSAYLVTGNSLFFDTSVFSAIATKKDPQGERWIWHQEGRTRSTALSGVQDDQAEFIARAKSLGLTPNELQLVTTGENELPARPFLGLSFEAEIQIVEVWDQWFDGAIAVGVSQKGKVFARHARRGPGGRFIPKES